MKFLVFSFLNFTDSVEEFEDRIMQKKMKIPKMSIKNSANSIENFFGDERMPLRHKKVGYVCTQSYHYEPFSRFELASLMV